jgi:hypothetical protein
VTEHLPSMCTVLSSIPRPAKQILDFKKETRRNRLFQA